MGELRERIYTFGGEGGATFHEEPVREIGFAYGKYVDAIFLNGVQHGGNGGIETSRLVLSADEYIDTLEIRAGRYIDFLRFSTNKGRWIAGGGGGGHQFIYPNIKLLAIAGRAGVYLDYLAVRMMIDETINPKPQN
ncbi:Jacalin-like lectin domain protein [compost metagenome]